MIARTPGAGKGKVDIMWSPGDVVLTRDEVAGLMANLLVSPRPPRGHTALSYWLKWHAETVGTRYASEVARHYQ
jgi:hypothetical protein